MKKLTLLLAAALMIAGGAYAQDKPCCKKGGKCTKSCKKDGAKESTSKDTKTTSAPSKAEQNKPKA